jgi:hypothetical protein
MEKEVITKKQLPDKKGTPVPISEGMSRATKKTKPISKKQPKETISKAVGSTIPQELIATKKTNWIFGAIFLLVIFIGLYQFPLGKLLQGNVDVKISFGIPWTFLEFDLANAETIPIKFGGLIGDMLIYLILAYALDVALNVFFKAMKSKKATRKQLLSTKPTQTKPIQKTAPVKKALTQKPMTKEI